MYILLCTRFYWVRICCTLTVGLLIRLKTFLFQFFFNIAFWLLMRREDKKILVYNLTGCNEFFNIICKGIFIKSGAI
jgi:hypothetical protein